MVEKPPKYCLGKQYWETFNHRYKTSRSNDTKYFPNNVPQIGIRKVNFPNVFTYLFTDQNKQEFQGGSDMVNKTTYSTFSISISNVKILIGSF